MSGLRNIEIQRRVLATECEDLKRQIANLRQRLKRARSPQDPKERYEYERQRNNPTAIRPLMIDARPSFT